MTPYGVTKLVPFFIIQSVLIDCLNKSSMSTLLYYAGSCHKVSKDSAIITTKYYSYLEACDHFQSPSLTLNSSLIAW